MINAPNKSLIACILICAFIVGCGSKEEITQLRDGYEVCVRTKKSLLNEPESAKISLFWKDSLGKSVTVWPIVHSRILIKEGTAVFAGDRTVGRSSLDGDFEMTLRLFVVKSPEPPIDITSEVVIRWATNISKDPKQAVTNANLIGMQEMSGQVQCHFEFDGGIWPGEDVFLNWSQIQEITNAVKQKASKHKDEELKIFYLE
ncbi:MAG: hypothetical protein ACXWDN_02435 [Limisphaerales bacterium]